jgi:hypothetical protein
MSLDALLKAEDLDDLLRVRRDISALTPAEERRISSILRKWTDEQAVANLLFNPDLIPRGLRFDALDRALNSIATPYLALAATVGLQQIEWTDVPDDKRTSWLPAVQRLVRSSSKVLAGRASAALCRWARREESDDLLLEVLSLYPVPDEGACRNIVATVLTRWADVSAQELSLRLLNRRMSSPARVAIQLAHETYHKLKARDEFRAMVMKSPAYVFIPSLSEAVLDESRSARARVRSVRLQPDARLRTASTR